MIKRTFDIMDNIVTGRVRHGLRVILCLSNFPISLYGTCQRSNTVHWKSRKKYAELRSLELSRDTISNLLAMRAWALFVPWCKKPVKCVGQENTQICFLLSIKGNNKKKWQDQKRNIRENDFRSNGKNK